MATLTQRLALCSAFGLYVSACAESAGPGITPLTVVTTSLGPATDPDGYVVLIDADRREPIGPADTLVVAGLAAGEHQLGLEGLAPYCGVNGDRVRTVNTGSNDGTVVQFDVDCRQDERQRSKQSCGPHRAYHRLL